MTALTDFNILKSICVPTAPTITPRGLIVVAGPNSSGKTQMLRDIQSSCTGDSRSHVVCENIEIAAPDSLDELIDALGAAGCISTKTDDKGREFFEQSAPYLGEGKGGWRLQRDQLQHHFSNLRTGSSPSRRAFFDPIGKMLITALFLDRRLHTVNECAAFDYESSHPQNELQALYVNERAQAEFTDEIRKTFGRGIWLDATRGGKLCLRVSDSPTVPPAEVRLQPEQMKAFRTIDTEGDGLKSYAAICISLLLGRRPICLIDEPEMCLHPPQAYALGRFIGRHGTSESHSTLVATHSSHILRGIIEETNELQILRLSRAGSRFVGNLIPYATLKECVDRPSTKVETILDGIFSEAVTIVESEGDRAVYEAATERVGSSLDHDVHFVSVGGVGGFASTSKLYRQLKIPTVVIADLDLITKQDVLKRVLDSLTTPQVAAELVKQAAEVAASVQSLGPAMDAETLRKRLAAIIQGPLELEDGGDDVIRRSLNSLANDLSRFSLLKRGGRKNLGSHAAIRHDLDALLTDCRREGLFLVPVGELEFWCEALMENGPSRQKKSEWANEAAVRIRAAPPTDDDVWSFVKRMAAFQRDQRNKLGGYAP